MTTDVHAAISHLSDLTSAVHHILHHLTTREIIPPVHPGLKAFKVPEGDMTLLTGFGVERNHDVPIDELNTRRKSSFRERKGTDEDDEFGDDKTHGDDRDNFPSISGSLIPVRSPIRQQSLGDQSWTTTISNRLSTPTVLPHRFSEPNIPVRPPIELTPTSELDILAQQQQIFPSVTPMAPPTLPSPSQFSPTYNLRATPTSLVKSSPGDIDPSLVFSVTVTPQTAKEPETITDESGAKIAEEILGEDDVRSSIIKLEVVSSGDARILVDQ